MPENHNNVATKSKRKRSILVTLSVLLVLSTVPISAFADNPATGIDTTAAQETVVENVAVEASEAAVDNKLLTDILGKTTLKPADSFAQAIEQSGVDLSRFEDYDVAIEEDAIVNEDITTAETLEIEDSNTMGTLSAKGLDIQAAPKWKRLQGPTRYETMAATIKAAFPKGSVSGLALITTGDNFPDALAASSFAGGLDAPIILTGKKSLNAAAAKQIKSLKITHAIIIGSKAAVSANVEKSIVKRLGKKNVVRCAGADRFATAYEIYKLGVQLEKVAGTRYWSDVAFVATGNNFPDALSVGPIAYKTASPIFLYDTSKKKFSAKQLKALKSGRFQRIVLLGSSKVLPESIRKDLGKMGSKKVCFRLSGADRYLTSAAIADFGIGTQVLGDGITSKAAAFATGENFPDALSGAALCAHKAAPLHLVKDTPAGRVGMYQVMARSVYHGTFSQGYVLGSTKAVPNSLISKAKAIGKPTKAEKDLVTLVNKERKKAGLPALKIAPVLQGVGDIRADELTIRFSQYRPYRDASGNLMDFSTAFFDNLYGNLILPTGILVEYNAMGYSTPSSVMKAWMNSKNHKNNILNKNFQYIGVGYVKGGPSNAPYWTLNFLG